MYPRGLFLVRPRQHRTRKPSTSRAIAMDENWAAFAATTERIFAAHAASPFKWAYQRAEFALQCMQDLRRLGRSFTLGNERTRRHDTTTMTLRHVVGSWC